MFLRDGDVHRLVANHGFSPDYEQFMRDHPVPRGRQTLVGRTALVAGVVHLTVLWIRSTHGPTREEVGGFRAMLGVPLLQQNEPIGVIALTRTEARPFTKEQIELVTTFADQAVIAIENVRLFEEVQARTRELSVALEQQTATSEVLKVISRSAFDLQTVLDTLVESAARLCDADMVSVTRPRGSGGPHYHAASVGFSPEWFEYMQTHPLEPDRGTLIGRALLERRIIHIPDVLADPEYTSAKAQQLGGFRAVLGIPMLREGTSLGVFMIARRTPRPFTDKQIELVTTFADQAVIAIENVRLFEEVQARTRGAERIARSSRPRQPTCSRSSAARPSTCKPCSIPLSSRRRDYARQMAALSFAAKARNLCWPQLTAYHRNIKIICGSIRFRPVGER